MAARDVLASDSCDDLETNSEFSREGPEGRDGRHRGGSLFDENIDDEDLLGNINEFLDVLKDEKEGDELVDYDALFGEDRLDSEEVEDPFSDEEPHARAAEPEMRIPPKDALLKTLLSTPAIICDLYNSGDFEKLQTFLESAFSEDMTLLTDPLRAPVTGRHHYFTFLKGLSEAFPDSVMTMTKSSLSRANKIVYSVRFSGTLMYDRQPVEGSHMFRRFSNEFADTVEKNAPRRLHAAEKAQLKQAEALVLAGKAYPHITSYVTGKYSVRKGPAMAGEERPPVVSAQIMWKVRGFSVLPISKFT